ncbi:MAG: hypothetical protein L6R40_007280 [Gallowayella cf. fulva]|nr:MAG: hypothetical protein L6R40_007280 [Xanthomendoza cf. fulva]
MLRGVLLPVLAVLLSGLVIPAATLPHNNLALLPERNDTVSSHSSLPRLGDWENFAYPIPRTKQILKGRILTSKRLNSNSLHFAIDGGLAKVQQQISVSSPNTRLPAYDNPFIYRVPGCYFEMESKVGRDGKPKMTWKMMKDVLSALEQVLEKQQRFFETSFVLTDDAKVSWGHGQVVAMGPPKDLAES